MHNFFNPIPTEEGNIYFMEWILNSSGIKDLECDEKAKIFISMCYWYSGTTNNDINKIDILDSNKNTLYCMVNSEDLLIIKTDISRSLYRIISDKQLETSFIHEDEISQKFKANKYLYIYLETQYTGNILQIEQETIYNVFPLENYIDYLLSHKICNYQILNEIAIYEKSLIDSYMQYRKIKYENWEHEQHKGFYRDLQRKLQNGEGKYDEEFGSLLYFDLFEIEKNGILIYFRLQHNTNTVTIRAGFNNKKEKKSQRPIYIKMITDKLASELIEFKEESRAGRSLYTTLATIMTPVIAIDKKGLIDMNKTIANLKHYQQVIDKI